jgi:hypothetical protein
MRFVAVYCASGPYRHVRRLVENAQVDWFPWGYRMRRGDRVDLRVERGNDIELWEVDDTRRPSSAMPLVVATVDFASHSDDYLAMTVRPTDAEVEADAVSVLRQAQDGRMLAPMDCTRQAAAAGGTVGGANELDRISDRSPISPAVTALSVGG